MRIYGFAPVEEKDAVLLIVGSMPSVMSLKDDFYYAHRQNAFWPMMAKIFSAPVPETKEAKKCLLLDHKIALWDVYASCVREGSLDSAIRAGEKNDFDVFFKAHPHIRAVLCNGKAAYDAFDKNAPVPVLRLPSTSPAYTMKFESKLALWQEAIKNYL
ncbi:MAG: DNA-deoxyinosine glycosylase [Clostridiales bacterium]|nr:DNA-deoxyinosine glycosylase [Clostridiales bacterium]